MKNSGFFPEYTYIFERGIFHSPSLIPKLLPGILMVCLLACTVLGCKRKDPQEDKIRLFYLNSENTAISARTYQLQAEAESEQIKEILDCLSVDYPEEGLTAPIKGFELKQYSTEDNVITLDFSAGYKKLDVITEKLVRAAIVNTLCELDSVRRVTIRVNGALVVDETGGKSEKMTSDQFIYNSGREMLNFERTEMHLYFASRDGKKLVETYRTVVYNGNIPMERLVVEQIIAGPNGDFNYPTINVGTRLLNILTRDNICTVTFDRTFLTNPYPVEPEVAIYSIVNSLTELPAIRQVQIIIDGEDHPVFMDHYVLDSENLLQKNAKIVLTRE